jgi:hypothetical protein
VFSGKRTMCESLLGPDSTRALASSQARET